MHQDPYWTEDACYCFSTKARDELEEATFQLHTMCLEAVDRVVHDPALMDRFEVF